MKIVSLTAENVKKIKAIEIKPNGALVEITGPNGSGKSSVLDTIYYALAGSAVHPSKPIRKGQEKAKIKLDLGELVVIRNFTPTGTALVVEAANGARFRSPQHMLDEMLGAISFDPLGFTRMDRKEQFEVIRGLVKLDVDIDALDGQNQRDFEERTHVNRQAKALRAQAASIATLQEGATPVRVDVAALLAEMEEAGKQNALLEQRKANRETAASNAKHWRFKASEQRREAADLRRRAEELDQSAHALEVDATNVEKKIAEADALPEPVDLAKLRETINAGTAINRTVDDLERKQEIDALAAAEEKKAEALTDAIAARTAQKETAIASAKMPVDGLGFGEGEILFDGLPFDQASAAEQLRISVAIAMAMNPKLRVLRIKDGSLLDEKSLELLRAAAQANDYQIWIERVDTSGKVGIVMEDGAIAGAEPPKEPAELEI